MSVISLMLNNKMIQLELGWRTKGVSEILTLLKKGTSSIILIVIGGSADIK